MSFIDKEYDNTQTLANRPAVQTMSQGLFLRIGSAMLLLQGFYIILHTLGSYSLLKEVELPLNLWWLVVKFRGVVWLLAIPILTVIIAQSNQRPSTVIASHIALFIAVVLFLGTIIHPFEHRQSDELTLLYKSHSTKEEVAKDEAISSKDSVDEVRADAPNDKPTKPSTYYECNTFFWYWFGEIGQGIVNYSLLSACGYAVLFFTLDVRRKQHAEQLHRSLIELQHQTLCNRLQPHFLFNTLNTISSLINHDSAAARKCITELGTLLRHSIESMAEQEICLEDEMEIVECYLKIQKLRYGDRLQIEIDVDEAVADTVVPAFLLQPLVENSFQHGFDDETEVAYVTVTAKQVDNSCLLEIRDNGASNSQVRWEERNGIGLTRERLNLQYGDLASIHFEPSNSSGMTVAVSIPMQG